ncbi:hypothetical protein TRVL_08865 [Trypanosoma vivax]|uniref:Uncharacterized protein n=1 Tax=Trypanosoma vivax (strain Y486) TaxID=1055687 RepID=G0U174_TRYVY|nr:hypothetical protein TRVL_08865 [Trypanosoma vivax]CCC49829.1 hypothetical protein TVY486_0804370 [Trypanosoma vivax Y486]
MPFIFVGKCLPLTGTPVVRLGGFCIGSFFCPMCLLCCVTSSLPPPPKWIALYHKVILFVLFEYALQTARRRVRKTLCNYLKVANLFSTTAATPHFRFFLSF